jgi:hypothetical protein
LRKTAEANSEKSKKKKKKKKKNLLKKITLAVVLANKTDVRCSFGKIFCRPKFFFFLFADNSKTVMSTFKFNQD